MNLLSLKHKVFAASCLLVITATGCTPFDWIGSGGQAIYNRYGLQQSIKNQKITASIKKTISTNPSFKNSHIQVDSFNFRVLLVGTVPSEALRKEAGQIAAYTPDVVHVYNFIDVSDKPHSSYLNDSWLTTKVKSKIIAEAKMPSNNIKVVTESGVLYLMGLVTAEQAEIAVETAQYISGVKHVVEVFEYISYSKKKPGNSKNSSLEDDGQQQSSTNNSDKK